MEGMSVRDAWIGCCFNCCAAQTSSSGGGLRWISGELAANAPHRRRIACEIIWKEATKKKERRFCLPRNEGA